MASNGINKVILIGNLTRDPEVAHLPNGTCKTSFSIATSETWEDKLTQEKKEDVQYHNITTYRRLAEVCGQYLKKGAKVYIEGKLKTDKWQDQQGNDKYKTYVEAREMQMLDRKEAMEQHRQNHQQQPQQRTPVNQPPSSGVGELTEDFIDL